LEVLKRIVLDLAEKKINVTAVKSSAQQIEYVSKLPKSLFPKGAKLKSPVELSKSIAPAPPPPAPPPSPPPPPPSPLARKTLVPQGFALQIKNQKAAQILFELRTLNLERYRIGGAMLLRALIEAAVDIYHDTNSLTKFHTAGKNKGKALNLSERVDQTLKHLPPAKASKQVIKAANDALLNPNSVISIRRLHEYTHNPAAFPSKDDLIASWSPVEGFLVAVFKLNGPKPLITFLHFGIREEKESYPHRSSNCWSLTICSIALTLSLLPGAPALRYRCCFTDTSNVW
jgi:hypothetical protein